jgi:hypothetical protein
MRRGQSTGYEIRIIAGPATAAPVAKKWSSYICNPANKTNLQIFLSDAWIKIAKTRLRFGLQLVLAGCFENCEDVRLVMRGSECSLHYLEPDHEEADTRMLLHAKDCSYHYTRVVVQSPDTDVAFLCIYAYQYLMCEQFWFRTGVKDKLRYIPVHTLTQKLGHDLCNLLPAFHVLTGCDRQQVAYTKLVRRKHGKY